MRRGRTGGVLAIDDGGDETQWDRLVEEAVAKQPKPEIGKGFLVVPAVLSEEEWERLYSPRGTPGGK